MSRDNTVCLPFDSGLDAVNTEALLCWQCAPVALVMIRGIGDCSRNFGVRNIEFRSI